MKKILSILILSFLTCSNIQAKKLFVEMEFHKNSIKLDDGSNKKRQPIKGDDGKDLKFTSLIGALNYMSLQGWELIDTKSVTQGGTYGGKSAFAGIRKPDGRGAGTAGIVGSRDRKRARGRMEQGKVYDCFQPERGRPSIDSWSRYDIGTGCRCQENEVAYEIQRKQYQIGGIGSLWRR